MRSGDETTEDVIDVIGARNGVTHKGEESYVNESVNLLLLK